MPFITQGKTNWKFLLIVIILAILAGGGALWFCFKFRGADLPPIEPPPKIEKVVSIITNKTEYETEEEVKFTLRNKTDQEIILLPYDLMVEKFEENKWKIIIRWGACCGKCLPTSGYDISPNSIKEFTWNQKTFACEMFGEVAKEMSTGNYRITGNYFIKGESQQNKKTIYSKELVIKERDKTADWKVYKNEEHTFELKYPQKWGLEILSDVSLPSLYEMHIIQPYHEERGEVYQLGSYVGIDLQLLVISSSRINIDEVIKDNNAKEIDLGNVMAWRYKRQIEGPEIMVLTEEVTLIPDKDFYIEISELANYGPGDYNFRSQTISTLLSTFRFTDGKIQNTGSNTEKISIRISNVKTIFNMENKSFETEDIITKKKFLVITNDSTKFYRKADDKIIGGYNDFSDFAYIMQNCQGISCPLQPTVEGILQSATTIKATDIYSFVQ